MYIFVSQGDCFCSDHDPSPRVAFTVRAEGVTPGNDTWSDIPLATVVTKINTVNNTWIFTDGVLNFTAPINGLYYFQVTAIASSNQTAPLLLVGEHGVVLKTFADVASSIGSGSVQLVLAKGGVVSLRVGAGYYTDTEASDVSFSGFLRFPITDDDVWF